MGYRKSEENQTSTMKVSNQSVDDEFFIWDEDSKKDRVAMKLLKHYKKDKRFRKIKKLLASNSHWSGLS